MSLNNRRFMMAELMITSVVIMISIVSLYTGFNKIYTNYKVRNSYDDSNLLYGTNILKENINILLDTIMYFPMMLLILHRLHI